MTMSAYTRWSGRVLRPEDPAFKLTDMSVVLGLHNGRRQGKRSYGDRPRDGPGEEIEAAREEAARIIAEARKRAAEEIERRCAEAVAAVEAEQRQAFAQAASELLAAIEEQWKFFREEMASQVSTIALEVAEKIVHRKLAEDADIVVSMAREALSKLTDAGRVRLVVSSDDADRLAEHKAVLLTALPPGTEIEVVADPSLGRGDIVVQSQGGEIDARLGTQLDAMRRTLRAAADVEERDAA